MESGRQVRKLIDHVVCDENEMSVSVAFLPSFRLCSLSPLVSRAVRTMAASEAASEVPTEQEIRAKTKKPRPFDFTKLGRAERAWKRDKPVYLYVSGTTGAT